MRQRLLVLLAVVTAILGYSQRTCGFDAHQQHLEKLHPEMREARLKAESNLAKFKKALYTNKINTTFSNGNYSGEIYTIPIVIHVIESSKNEHKVTDEQIRTWINNTNQMYATTYGNGFFAEGTGADGGTVIPFRLALAQRSPQCTATTGIIRYDGSTLNGYDDHGVNSSNNNGATEAQVKELAPHWPESSYFNIYLITGFDSNFSNSGLMGWAGYPTNSDSSYESFMKIGAVRNRHDTTLAHEFGHSMGLDHPFGDADSSGGVCPTNDDCTTDNDKVCDTEPTQSLLSVFPTPDNNTVNPCTGENYQGVQYNVMNYTYETKKFTPGQRERALALFLENRRSLTTSLGATAPDNNTPAVAAASCVPQAINNSMNYNTGPTNVTLANLNVSSSGYTTLAPQFYVDYTAQACINPAVTANITEKTESEISISIRLNNQYIKAWIDYNNDGIFTDNEIIANSSARHDFNTPFISKFTPPTTTVKDIPLRMRVRADFNAIPANSCDNLVYGQVEDYAVIIATKLGTNNTNTTQTTKVIYNKTTNRLILSGKDKFGEYKILDMTGKVLQNGNANSNEIYIFQTLPKGVYIIHFEGITQKFIIQ
ncbi:MAG: GEVED domain-containing protein [Cruoricaptor ignavus]|nr:GEVED domain-containing protein [Cruoricaptor ignavus]